MKIRLSVARGSVLIIGLVLAAFLAALALTFANRIGGNQVRIESDIAQSRALELANTACNVKIATIWSQFQAQPTASRVQWLSGEDLNTDGVLNGNEDVNYDGALTIGKAPTFSDSDWVPMGDQHYETNPSYAQIGWTCTRVNVMALAKDGSWTDVRFTTWARVPDDLRGGNVADVNLNSANYYTYKKVQRIMRYSLGAAQVFDYVYFANNYGWMYGSSLYLYGPMGANGNLGFSDHPTVDGPLYAAATKAIGAPGVITNGGKTVLPTDTDSGALHDTLAQFKALQALNPLLYPTNPPAPGLDHYDIGYDGSQTRNTAQKGENMPFLNDLSTYKNLASTYIRPANASIGDAGGAGAVVKQLKAPGLDPTIATNYNILIDKSYGYNGENGMISTLSGGGAVTTTALTKPLDATTGNGWKNGNLALIGTPAQPIVIQGPVVVSNDLVIKGTVTGQGTFYVGRNTHIVGDVTYKNAPVWSANDTNFNVPSTGTAAVNKTKDGVGFAVKGNVVLGNYTDATSGGDWAQAFTYIKPPFTAPYTVDPSDFPIGYGDGTPTGKFNGDYTALDGGKFYNDDNSPPSSGNRSYYQSSFSNAYIKSVALARPTNIQGIFYTNHYFGGRVENMKLYGVMVARDEGIVTQGTATFLWDVRASKKELSTYVNLFLPRDSVLQSIMWKEASKDSPQDDCNSSSPDWISGGLPLHTNS